MKLPVVTNYVNNNCLHSCLMSERKGPFGLRLPGTLFDWLKSEADHSSRSTTSEALFQLRNSLDREFCDEQVENFIKNNPPSDNTEAFGLRIPDDLKAILKMHSDNHQMSLNQEIVMRLASEKHHRSISNDVIHAHANGNGFDGETMKITDSEKQFLLVFRKLNTSNKELIIRLIKNLGDSARNQV